MRARTKNAAGAVGLIWWHLALFLSVAVGLTFLIKSVAPNIQLSPLTSYLALKAGLIGFITSAVLFFYKSFFDDVTASEDRLGDIPHLIASYMDFFRFLFITNVLLFGSIMSDFYLIASPHDYLWVKATSLGFFAGALAALFAFMVILGYRLFSDLYVLGRASSHKKQGAGACMPEEAHVPGESGGPVGPKS